VEHTVALKDKRLAKIVKRVRELPGQELFQYVAEDDARMPVHSQDVNEYIERIAGAHFTAKDFRTWEGTMYCALALAANDAAETLAERKRNLVEAIATVAKRLGNTPAVCKKSYIHPGVIDAYLESGALQLVARRARKASVESHALSSDESKVLAFIEKLITRDEGAHLNSLLKKSVRQASQKRQRKTV
jgi:DNA topoisomerase-1